MIDTIKILFDAGELSLKKAEYKDDQDALDYLADLRTNILTCYSAIVSGAKDSGKQEVILQAAPNIFNYL